MRKIKIFTDGNTTELEKRVNQWFAEHTNVSVNEILQSESDAGGFAVTITIFYIDMTDEPIPRM